MLAEAVSAAAAAPSSAALPAWLLVTLGLIGTGGITSFVLALMKLRPEANAAAMSQAKGANESLVSLNEALQDSLERANKRISRLENNMDTANRTITALQEVITGFRIMENDRQFPPRPAASPEPPVGDSPPD